MKISRFKKWLVVSVIIMPCLFLLERERRIRIVVGSWQFLNKGLAGNESKFHHYEVFNRDGTGKTIVEEDGEVGSFPFKYELVGLSQTRIESDYSFYGIDVVSWDDPRLRTGGPPRRITFAPVSIGFDRDHLNLNVDQKYKYLGETHWQRVEENLLPVEK